MVPIEIAIGLLVHPTVYSASARPKNIRREQQLEKAKLSTPQSLLHF